MSVSKAQQKATHKYMAKAYDRINLFVPKGQRDAFKAHASSMGESVNAFIGRAIKEQMERDNPTGGGNGQASGSVVSPSSIE
jgi:predicted HicB family RNase H-like nuclease